MIGWMLDQAVSWVLDTVRDTLNLVWKLVASTLFQLPDVTTLPQVQALTARSLMVVNTAYVLAIIAAGIVVMARDSLQIRYGAAELIPRLVIGLAAANFATTICVTIISTANALVLSLTGEGIASTGALGRWISISTTSMVNPVAGLLSAVIGVLLVVLVVMLAFGWVTRFVWLVILCGIGPVALACHGTPWTEGAARLWWRSIGGICATVILQAVILNTALSVLLTPGTNLSRYGMPDDSSGLLSLFLTVVLLWITVRVPGLVRRYLTQSGGRPNLMGTLIRLIIAQQITRGIAGAVRSVAGSLRGASGAAHRPGSGRHIRGRTTGDPLRGFGTQRRPAPAPRQARSGGRPARPYTRAELAEGVDLYTRAMKARTAGTGSPPGQATSARTLRVTPAGPTARTARPPRSAPRPTPSAGGPQQPGSHRQRPATGTPPPRPAPLLRTDPPRTPPRRTPPPNRRTQ